MNNTLQYIIRFLLNNTPESDELSRHIGYTAREELFSNYKLVIIPSLFFTEGVYGTPLSLPESTLPMLEEVPVLYGKPLIEQWSNTLVVHADILASSFFLLSRYEETLNDTRDEHGRFPGKASTLYRIGRMSRPLVDEYGRLLRQWLREAGLTAPEPPAQINRVCLTHDVDAPFKYRTYRGLLRAGLREGRIVAPLKTFLSPLTDDPFYTFPWLFEQNKKLQEAKTSFQTDCIAFFKAGGKTRQDRPYYNLYSQDIRELQLLCEENAVTFGLHASYESGKKCGLIKEEKERLSEAFHLPVSFNRHHFLRSCEPQDMQALIDSGITDDFTMGYADVAGFRLGTSRPVHWIDPESRQVTSLLLHPLTIMDCSLTEQKYMGLRYEEAGNYCRTLLDETERNAGDVTLLWHNTSVEKGKEGYLRRLYTDLIADLTKR